jgi:hypothetical protein
MPLPNVRFINFNGEFFARYTRWSFSYATLALKPAIIRRTLGSGRDAVRRTGRGVIQMSAIVQVIKSKKKSSIDFILSLCHHELCFQLQQDGDSDMVATAYSSTNHSFSLSYHCRY